MKIFTLSLFILFSTIAISQESVDYSTLILKDGKKYTATGTQPFTGQCFTLYKGGEKGLGGNYKDGIKSGDWIWWYKNGKKKRHAKFVDGQLEGKSTYWYKNGVKKSEIYFSENQNLRQISYNEKGERVANPSFSKFK